MSEYDVTAFEVIYGGTNPDGKRYYSSAPVIGWTEDGRAEVVYGAHRMSAFEAASAQGMQVSEVRTCTQIAAVTPAQPGTLAIFVDDEEDGGEVYALPVVVWVTSTRGSTVPSTWCEYEASTDVTPAAIVWPNGRLDVNSSGHRHKIEQFIKARKHEQR